ncbi:MAG: hypothetical protein WB660_17370 [Candidatus Sulfotelmatobacter sp.]
MKELLTTKNVFLVVLFLGLFAMAARNVTDPDLWWHLKTGQFIVAHKSVPRSDPFSYTRAGAPWVAHEWLSEVLLYELERTTGWGGLIAVFAAALCAAFFLLYLRCGPNVYVAGVATLCAAWATMPVWGVRPQVLSVLLTSLWLLILERSERKPKLLWWTLPLTLLWVNLHAGFALGLALSGSFLVAERIESALGRTQNTPRLRKMALIFLLDLLLVPLNPNGLRMFWYPIETLRSAAMQNYIAEWASPNFHHLEYWPLLLLILSTFAVLGWSRLQVRPRDLLLLLVSLYTGLCSIRLMPLFVLIAVPLISKQFGTQFVTWPGTRPRSGALPRPSMVATRTVLNGTIAAAMALFAGVHIAHVVHRQPQAEMQNFPAGAVSFLKAHPAAGAIFNHYDWGGYLIWKLYPSSRVFIDGRADLYGEQLLREFADTYQFRDHWEQTLRRWNIDRVLVPADSALATGLRSAAGWTVSYEDAQAVILTSPRPGAVALRLQRNPFLVKPGLRAPNPHLVTLFEPFAGYYE